MADNEDNGEGVRKDGKPYQDGNTRADGSYAIGKGRTPEVTRFRKDDGRKRGKRPKGGKNLDTIWRKQLAKPMTIKGETRSKLEWAIEGLINRAVVKSDRAAEIVFDRAARLEQVAERGPALSDRALLDAWMSRHLSQPAGAVTDDADVPLDENASGGMEEGDEA